ncbi:hypothetical protein TSAR_000601, partial [Trichomalopsis sarcophagae]
GYKDCFISTTLTNTLEKNDRPPKTLKLIHHCLKNSMKNAFVLTNVKNNDSFLSNYLTNSQAPSETMEKNSHLCRKDVFFNKVKQLHGYNLKTLVNSDRIMNRYDKTKVGYQRFDGIEYYVHSFTIH